MFLGMLIVADVHDWGLSECDLPRGIDPEVEAIEYFKVGNLLGTLVSSFLIGASLLGYSFILPPYQLPEKEPEYGYPPPFILFVDPLFIIYKDFLPMPIIIL